MNNADPDGVREAVLDCVAATRSGWRRSTCYLSSRLTVKATRQQPRRKNERQVTIIVTIGRPNFAERRYIRLCKKTHSTFPQAPHLEAFPMARSTQ